jgi:hypothetical protein
MIKVNENPPSAYPTVETGNITVKAALWEVGPLTVSGARGIPCRDVLIVGVDRFSGGYVCNAVDGVAQSIVCDHNTVLALYEALRGTMKIADADYVAWAEWKEQARAALVLVEVPK